MIASHYMEAGGVKAEHWGYVRIHAQHSDDALHSEDLCDEWRGAQWIVCGDSEPLTRWFILAEEWESTFSAFRLCFT